MNETGPIDGTLKEFGPEIIKVGVPMFEPVFNISGYITFLYFSLDISDTSDDWRYFTASVN